ncbi:MAG TPA: ABC transporter ATP-binding protein [Haloplasmataceae bacterium]
MLLVVDNVSGGYKNKNIIQDLSFQLDLQEILCILGPNGSGKSTLLKLLLRFLPLDKGDIYIDNNNVKSLSRKLLAQKIAYIPQKDSIIFPYTNLEIVTMGRTSSFGSLKVPSNKDFEYAYKVLEELNITHLAHKQYTKISGGERQLVLIARAICQNAQIYIMDEPTSSLDFSNQKMIIDIIKKMAQERKTIIFTTHNPQEPFLISTKVLLLSQGKKVGFGNPTSVLTKENLEKVYHIPIDIITIKDSNNISRNICLT